MSIQMSQFLRRVSLAMVIAAGTAWTMPALAQQGDAPASHDATDAPSEGKSLFQKAAKAIAEAQAITFDAKLTPEGTTLTRAYTPSETSVKALRKAEAPGGWLLRVSGTSGDQKLDVAWRPSSLEGIDHNKKSVVERAGAQTPVPGLRTGQMMRLPEVFAAQPYRDAISATEYTMEGEQTVAGELCDVVVANVQRSGKKFRFAIAKKDSFPRKIEQLFESTTMQGKLTIETSNVKIDTSNPPALTEDDLRVKVPEGYTEDRQAGRPTVHPVPGKQPAHDAPGQAQPDKHEPAPAATPAPAPTPKGPQAAADFELSTPTGDKVSLASLKGKVVVMEFWGSWCLPCRDWHKTLADTVKGASGDKMSEVQLLALSAYERDNQNAITELAARDGSLKLLLGAGPVAKAYEANVFPATVVIDKDGMIGAMVMDTDSAATDSIKEAVRKALGIAGEATKESAKTEEVAVK